MEDRHRVLGVHITDRAKKAAEVQQILTEFGCNIKTRIGLHHVNENFCSPRGLIILELFGEDAVCDRMRDRLRAIPGVQVQEMVFDHPG